jgi:uncharacterized phiE125 gp8 family phage protein
VYQIRIKTDGSEPITQAELTNFLKYDEDEATELALIVSLGKSARQLIEEYLNVSLTSKTYTLEFDNYAIDDYHLTIPRGPVVNVISITQYDNEGTATELTDNSDYYLRGSQDKNVYFPVTYEEYYYKMEYIAGYGGSGVEALPEALKIAVMELAKYWYDREEQDRHIPETIKAKLLPYSKNFFI